MTNQLHPPKLTKPMRRVLERMVKLGPNFYLYMIQSHSSPYPVYWANSWDVGEDAIEDGRTIRALRNRDYIDKSTDWTGIYITPAGRKALKESNHG